MVILELFFFLEQNEHWPENYNSTVGQRVIIINALDFSPPVSSILLNINQDTEIQSGLQQGHVDTNPVYCLSMEFQRLYSFLHTVSK